MDNYGQYFAGYDQFMANGLIEDCNFSHRLPQNVASDTDVETLVVWRYILGRGQISLVE